MDIDFVITWVDGSDIEWQKKKAKYKGTPFQNADVRYRDWDILRYWFRAVEQYAPWVHRIYFVSDNQRPAWLNTDAPKLTLVNHTDFIPQEYLPTFNSNCIEAFMYRIPGLSGNFVSFNDDMFINQPITSEYYFHNGKPSVGTYEHVFEGRGYNNYGWGISETEYRNVQVLNAHFNRQVVTAANRRGWYGRYLGAKYLLQALMIKMFHRTEFQHFYTPHNEKAFLRETFKKIWEVEPNLLRETCTRFREPTNLNLYLARLWQIAENNFWPTDELNHKKVIQLHKDCIPQLKRMMFDSSIKSLCLNDSSDCTIEDYEQLKPQIIELFEKKLPKKSSFETAT